MKNLMVIHGIGSGQSMVSTKSNNKTPLRFISGRPLVPFRSLKVSPSLLTIAFKSHKRSTEPPGDSL